MAGKTTLKPGSKGWDWLGTGVYFWIENYRMAQYWGAKLRRDNPDRALQDTPAILKCEVNVGLCLNLANCAHINELENFLRELRERGFYFPEKNHLAPNGHHLEGEMHQRFLDHKIIDTYDELMENKFDSVLGVFENGPSIVAGSGLYRYNSIQIAVRERNLRSISYIAIDSA